MSNMSARDQEILLDPNKLVQFLKKPANKFTKKDLIKYIVENNIKMLNFRYIGGDGKIKALNFVINSMAHLEQVLTTGERVDGSSLFPYIDASSSDLYVVPRYKTAFRNPFAENPTLDILCAYYTKEGKPLKSSPEYLVKKAHDVLKEKTGYTMEALGELEYYVFSEMDEIYKITPQRGYHESHPFSKWAMIRLEAMKIISEIGGKIKYAHSEVGNIISGDKAFVQHEIEFLPVPIEEAADQLVLAKWVLREIAYQHNLEISFAPKIIVGHAGSGLHIHTRLVKDNTNMIVDEKGINDTGKKLIAGLLNLSKSLTAFGNTVPTSFLRLVPHQEAPTSICWGDRNRSVLVRVPLGWIGVDDMIYTANPLESKDENENLNFVNNQTVELRNPDGSANVHQLLAGMAVAARFGILNEEKSLEIAKKLYSNVNIAEIEHDYEHLPESCYEAGDMLLLDRTIYEEFNVFPKKMIDGIAKELKSFDDRDLSERIFGNGDALQKLVDENMHCG